MVQVQYWLAYHPHYGDESLLGRALLEAQSDTFVVEGCGVPISRDIFRKIKVPMGTEGYPMLSQNTTQEMYNEAIFAMTCKACTYGDLDRFRTGDMSVSNLHGSGYDVALLRNNTSVYLSQTSTDLHARLATSTKGQSGKPSQHERTDSRKNIVDNLDHFLQHRHLKRSHLNMMERAMSEVSAKITEEILEEYGNNDNGEDNMRDVVGQTVWPAETSPRGPIQKRKKNVSG